MTLIITACRVVCDYCGYRTPERDDYPRDWTHVLLENGRQVTRDRCPDCKANG